MADKAQHWHVGDVLEALCNYNKSGEPNIKKGKTYTVTKVTCNKYNEYQYQLNDISNGWALWPNEWKLISKKNISEMSSGEFFKAFANEIKNGTT